MELRLQSFDKTFSPPAGHPILGISLLSSIHPSVEPLVSPFPLQGCPQH